VAIEWKQPGYKPRASGVPTAQDYEIEAIKSCGGRAAKVRNWEELEALVRGIPAVQMGIKG
jgi:hypothetical protein